MNYRKCFVPTCKNDTKNSPNKIFVRIRGDLLEKWCREVKTEYFKVYTRYCCEDHLELKEDLKNYYQCKLMKQEPKLKASASLRNIAQDPSEDCSELSKLLLQPTSNSRPLKRKQEEIVMPSTSTCPTMPTKINVATQYLQPTSNSRPLKRKHQEIVMPSTSTCPTMPTKINVATQYKTKMVDKSTNYICRKSVTNIATVEVISSQEPSSVATPSLVGCTSETEESTVHESTDSILKSRKIMLETVYRKPKMYLGLPKPYLWLIEYITGQSSVKIDSLHLVITLLKIKQNDSLQRISDQFDISRTKLSSIILSGIEVLANFFQNFIHCPHPKKIKENLPLVFEIRYSDVQMIIDCFEIPISKPSNPVKQAQTWSRYKNCNTVKYLIGCTPNGFVSFISKGYGGRISDKAIVEKSNLLNVLNPNTVILADRGFNDIESLLNSHGIKLLRPPTVYTGTKLTKSEALQSKVIASLRVHVERVIRRVREYALLKPHSVVSCQFVPYLDEIVMIVCGLINLQ